MRTCMKAFLKFLKVGFWFGLGKGGEGGGGGSDLSTLTANKLETKQ